MDTSHSFPYLAQKASPKWLSSLWSFSRPKFHFHSCLIHLFYNPAFHLKYTLDPHQVALVDTSQCQQSPHLSIFLILFTLSDSSYDFFYGSSPLSNQHLIHSCVLNVFHYHDITFPAQTAALILSLPCWLLDSDQLLHCIGVTTPLLRVPIFPLSYSYYSISIYLVPNFQFSCLVLSFSVFKYYLSDFYVISFYTSPSFPVS